MAAAGPGVGRSVRHLLVCALCLAGCRATPSPSPGHAAGPDANPAEISRPTTVPASPVDDDPIDASRPPPSPELETRLRERARAVLAALSARDMKALAALADPARGLRFSPYSSVDTEADVVLSPAELRAAMRRKKVLTWGSYDGSGFPIELTFAGYYQRFVWSQDFRRAPELTVDRGEPTGNTSDNLGEVYPPPSAHFVEAFLEGPEKFGGMAWQSLRLVFIDEPADGRDDASVTTLRLVGIVHGQWTT